MAESSAVPVRDASTVVLVRDGADGIEVFLQRRVKQMAFAGGMTVFPGGGVDPRDRDADIRWTGPEVDFWADVFSTDEESARALVCAAVRETFEECGVLLAGTTDAVHDDPAALFSERARLEAKEISLGEFLAAQGLVLRADLLRPLAHWITPENESRRYDTRFFLASMPDRQEADGETSEAAETKWMSATAALADWDAGNHFLLPPTWTQLRDVSSFTNVDDLLAAQREITAIQPTISDGSGIAGLRFADSDSYLAALSDGRGQTSLSP
ncbi:NUDIX domain-containing protein [Gordonia sp. HY002]|uniref:NUDIX hydrolase n=1 Tax=Gordonia zhenghanii TaxID=2911516 RepID=UPI001EEFCFE9|nr:NUDIX domain-containing protein [Gordonia zhenghanii]MCF8571417.1 NUDIX domain-containing protein [Gordonia zhenghanii]MCF8606737.1 NUDIX domain-containing protein [Gordonia zhenghanii]